MAPQRAKVHGTVSVRPVVSRSMRVHVSSRRVRSHGHLVSSGKDGEGYYLIVDPGKGGLLETFLQTKNRHPALNQPRSARNRRYNWMNARRLVSALELLHSQGTIHRNIDGWSVVTALGDEPDFRLTGFEWSIRIRSAASRSRRG
jgi:hypothetical protein